MEVKMSICEDLQKVFPESAFPQLTEYYSLTERCRRIYSGEPDWRTVKKNGLYRGGSRTMGMLNTAKVLCDKFAVGTLSETPETVFSNKKTGDFISRVLEENSFMSRLSETLSYAYALGGCVFRPYICEGKIGIDCVFGDGFIPAEWDWSGIKAGCFRSTLYRGGRLYTLYEMHRTKDGVPLIENHLFVSGENSVSAEECSLSEVYPMLSEKTEAPWGEELACFRTAVSNNIFPELPIGLSVFANAADTLKALDIAFDSLSREFVLGKKRIIVPSSCVQTVVDIATGEQRQYFDADDEAYVALKCDEERDLKITDNTVELRVDEHIKAINALLNILSFQTGLSAGTFSFDVNEGVKTATEIISRDSRTAATIRSNQNNLAAALEKLFRTIGKMGAYLGELTEEEAESCRIQIRWHDGIITDENTLISNNIRLVESGLKSKTAAVMEILKCDEKTAEEELAKIAEGK